MNTDRTTLTRSTTLLAILTIGAFGFRFLPYWKEQYEGWLLCLWGANAVLPLFMIHLAKNRSLVWAYGAPMLGFAISDIIIQLLLQAQQLPTASIGGRLFIYTIFLVLAQLGLVLRYKKLDTLQTTIAGVGMTLIGSVLFFLVTNFFVWMNSKPADAMYYYPPTWAGLAYCYELALPFFKNQFFGDLIFSVSFFGLFALLERRQEVTAPSNVTI